MTARGHSRRSASSQGIAVCPLYPRLRPNVLPCSERRGEPRAEETRRGGTISLGLDTGGLDHRPPLLDLGLVVGGERLRSLLIARRNLLPIACGQRARSASLCRPRYYCKTARQSIA